jgi:hypothetical protein
LTTQPGTHRAPARQVARAAAKAGITDDDIATLLGYGDGIYSLFWRKLAGALRTLGMPDAVTQHLAGLAAYQWADGHPGACGRCVKLGRTLQSGLRSWQLAEPAAMLWRHDPDGCDPAFDQDRPVATLAVFTAADNDASWAAGPTPEARARVLWQMDTAGVSTGHAIVLFLPSGELRSYEITHDATLTGQLAAAPESCDICDDIMLLREMGGAFSLRVAEMNPPAPEGPPDADLATVRARFTMDPGKAADIDPETWAAWLADRDDVSTAARKAAETETRIRAELGDARILRVGGADVAYRMTYDSPTRPFAWHQDIIRRIPARTPADD